VTGDIPDRELEPRANRRAGDTKRKMHARGIYNGQVGGEAGRGCTLITE